MFRKVLIANRGEIAVRIAATCQALGATAAMVYSDADAHALHVRMADEAYPIGRAAASASYLDIEAVVQAAERANADALHPGYGFLSENPALADACAAAGITFIGPSPAAMRLLGNKIAAKRLAHEAGVPTLPGYHGPRQDDAELWAQARRLGAPLLIKAAAGGGGRGMREVRAIEAFPGALEAARREARAAFGDDAVLLERLIEAPRHVEFQIIGDAHGSIVHMGERECSIQRRHQKIVEEAPSTAITPDVRREMGAAAVRIARAAGYTNAGTVEFVVAPDGRYYFLEMNARLQVEHAVTELVTGLDLVALQLRVACGDPLPFTQDDIVLRGHALECRVYAEDVAAGFLPATGRLLAFKPPRGPGIRVDSGVTAGDDVTVHYDAMLAKLIASGATREQAIERCRWALQRFAVLGVTTNIPFLRRVIAHPAFIDGDISTAFVQRHPETVLEPSDLSHAVLLLAAAWQVTTTLAGSNERDGRQNDPWRSAAGWSLGSTRVLRFASDSRDHAVAMDRTGATAWTARIDDALYEISSINRPNGGALSEITLRLGAQVIVGHVIPAQATLLIAHAGETRTVVLEAPPDVDDASFRHFAGPGEDTLNAPMPGTVLAVLVEPGEHVREGQRLVVLEAMKMEHVIEAPYAGTVRHIPHVAGDIVAAGDRVVDLERT